MKQASNNEMEWETNDCNDSPDPNSYFPQWEHLLTMSTRPIDDFWVNENGPRESNMDFQPLSLRLNVLRPRLEARIRLLWPGVKLKEEISHAVLEHSSTDTQESMESKYGSSSRLKDRLNKNSISIALIGVIQKLHGANQSEIQRWCKGIGVLPLPIKKSVNSHEKERELFLSDTKTTIRLTNEGENRIPYGEIVSGVVCGIKGYVRFDHFVVDDVVFPTLHETIIWPAVTKLHNVEMVFISGLHIGKLADNFVYRNLLLEYLQGIAGNPAEQQHIVRRKTRAFILGNSFWKNQCKESVNLSTQAKTVKAVDDFLAQLSETMEVFLLPGKSDPTVSPSLPQPPLHSMMFPKSTQIRSFHRLANPTNITVSVSDVTSEKSYSSAQAEEKLHMILCSGKNVSDAMKASNIKCPLKMSKKLLEWSHIHPTEVQNVSLYNGKSEDVFCLPEKLPNLFVVGNQESFGVENWKGVKILSVPSFEKTHTIAFLNFELDVQPINFNIFFNPH